MKKNLKLLLLTSIGFATVFGTTSFVVSCSCGEFLDKTIISASQINTQLQTLTATFTGKDGNGILTDTPKWSLEHTKLVYGFSNNATPPTSYSENPPMNLTTTSSLYLSVIVTDTEQYEIDGKVVPKIIPVTGLSLPIEIKPINDALSSLIITIDTTKNDGSGTFTVSTWNVPNTSLQFASTRNPTPPTPDQYTSLAIVSLSNGDTLWITAAANAGFYINGTITPKSVSVSGLAKVLDITPINRALGKMATDTTLNGTVSGSTDFSTSAWNVTGTKLQYAISSDGTTVPTTGWVDYATKPSSNTLTNSQFIWYQAVVLSGYSFNGTMTPTKYSVGTNTLNTGVDLTTVSNALIAIANVSTDNKNSGHATLVAPTNYSVTGTTLIYAVGDSQPNLSDFSTTLPTNLYNQDKVWITAKALPTYVIVGGSPSIVSFTISGLNEEINRNDVQNYMNSNITLEALGIYGLSGSATFDVPKDWTDHFDGIKFQYKKSTDANFADAPPTGIANGMIIDIQAVLLSGYAWDTTPTASPVIHITVSDLVNPVQAQDVNDALNDLTLATNDGPNGAASFNVPTWDTTGNTKIAGTELRWQVTSDSTAPVSDDNYSTEPITDLYNEDYIWVKAFVTDDSTHQIVGEVIPVSLYVTGLVTHIPAANIQTLLNALNFTNSIISGNNNHGTFAALAWTDKTTKLQYGTSTAANIEPTNYQDTAFSNLTNGSYLFIKAVVINSSYAIDGTITSRSFVISGLNAEVDATKVNAALTKIKTDGLTLSGANGSATFSAPAWTGTDLTGTTLKYAKSTSATTPTDAAFTLTTPPTGISNNDYIYIKAFIGSGYTVVNGTISAIQIQVTSLKDSVDVSLVNTKLAALTVTITGTSGSGTFTAPSWTTTGTTPTGVAGTILQYGQSDDQTTKPTYSSTLPTNLTNGKYLWITAIADSTHQLTADATPKIIAIVLNQSITPTDANTALNLITGLTYTGIAGSTSAFNNPTYSVTHTSLVYATSTTDAQPAIANFSATKPAGFSNGDFIWITAKSDNGYIFSSEPVVKKYTVAGVNVAASVIQTKVDALTGGMHGLNVTIHAAYDEGDATTKINASIYAGYKSQLDAIKIDSNDSITFTWSGTLYVTSQPNPVTFTLHFSGHGVTISKAFTGYLINPPV